MKRTIPLVLLASAAAWPSAFAQTTSTSTSPGASVTAPPAQAASGDPMEGEVIELSPFEVSVERDTGYVASETLAGTRIRTELRDVGAAISVITREMLTDIGATDNSTLLQYTTNAEVAGTRGTYAGLGNGTDVDETGTLRAPGGAQRVRGLSAADNTRDFFVSDIPWDSYNVDRIDIQRGPNSILFGLGKPAGMVNASMRNAMFRTGGEVQGRIGSYGSWRTSLDYNHMLIENTLAIRVAGLADREKFRQDAAFEDDERVYAALRFDPQLFGDRSMRTSIRLKYENGSIDANRPRITPPNDSITPFFRPAAVSAANPLGGLGGGGSATAGLLTNSYDANREDTPAVGGDGRGQMRSADPDYNPWYASQGNDQQPFYFVDGATGQLYRIYGGFINNGARNSSGAVLTNNSAIAGRRYAGVFNGIQTLSSYATSARLPGYQYGQYRTQTLMDPTVFNFYDTLIDGPNKSEWENWDAYNINLSQTAFNDRLGVDLVYDRQKYDRGGQGLLGYQPTVNLDVLRAFQDLAANPNVGRPYVSANGNGTSYVSDREYMRASLFGELRGEDVFDSSFLRKLVGRQRFNGVYSSEDYFSENRSWNLYATNAAWDQYTSVNLPFNDRPPLAMIYLGPAINSRTTASGAYIPGLQAPVSLNDGSLYHFSSLWTNYSVAFNDPWTPTNGTTTNLTDANAQFQSANPANYKGWNSDYYLDILRYEDGDQSLLTNANKALRKTESYAGSWQSFWWDGALVGTFGWRHDRVRGKDVRAPSTGPRTTLKLGPGDYDLPASYLSDFEKNSTSWGVVLHVNRLFGDRDPLPINVSFSYNTSDNFEVAGTRRDLYGEVLGNPTGETEDYGIVLATKDGKYTFRAVKYEAKVSGTSTPISANNVFGNIISQGLSWRNVFLYNLNAYTLDTASGSNEWRYNFDPDTAIGETQEQATARENAAIAAWNEIQTWLPPSYYTAWGYTTPPPANLSSPTAAEVQRYPDNKPPGGFTLTSDTLSEGYEFELTANPLPNWRIAINASKTEAMRSNVGDAKTVEFVNFISEKMAGPAGELRQFSGGPTATTFRINWNNWIAPWTLFKLQEGASSSEIRPWRFNLVTNYTFRSGFLKDVGVGGSYRWQDKVVIGYPVLAVSATNFTFDLDSPYHGPSEDAVDLWASYERRVSDKIRWKIQLNVRNAFADDGLIPISVQPDGQTWAAARVKPTQEWFVTNTFSF